MRSFRTPPELDQAIEREAKSLGIGSSTLIRAILAGTLGMPELMDEDTISREVADSIVAGSFKIQGSTALQNALTSARTSVQQMSIHHVELCDALKKIHDLFEEGR